jgi:5-methylcytosine-specific restriction endonuclease McrA
MRQKKVWLNPEYQREAVWTLSQKQLLIDSIFLGIDIPKLYFREIDKEGYEYEVVDGQQRLRAISEFHQDQYKTAYTSDPIEGEEVAGLLFSKLPTTPQMAFNNYAVDVTVLVNYSDDDIEEMFLRLQNGTPLNAAEKRRAIKGNMRNVIEELSKHKIFSLCSFSSKRYAYEDAAAKILHEIISPVMTDIKPISIARTYEINKEITNNDVNVKLVKKSLNFIYKSLKDKSPKFKKYAILTLTHLVSEMLETYDLSSYSKEFADCYIDFELRRKQNEELSEEKQDSRLAAYTDAARADSVQDLQYRHDFLLEEIIKCIPTLKLKDPSRDFTEEQRMAIYWKNKGICQVCGKECKDTEFHADHILPWSKGNPTSISNGQVLCAQCNFKKGASI